MCYKNVTKMSKSKTNPNLNGAHVFLKKLCAHFDKITPKENFDLVLMVTIKIYIFDI